MAHVFFKNPKDGTYAVYSTVIDQFLIWDAENLEEFKKSYVEYELKNAEERIKAGFDAAIERLDNDTFKGITWDFAKNEHNRRQKDNADKIK